MTTYRALLRDVAFDQHGYVTVGDAAELEVPAVELRKLAQRGWMDRIGRGLYRMREVPAGDVDQYAAAVLLVGRDAHLTRDAVLALHGLAVVNPRRIRVGTPHRVRGVLPGFVEMVRERIPEADLTSYQGIASTTVARAVVDSVGLVMPSRLRDALRQAQREGLVTRSEAASARAALTRRVKTIDDDGTQ